MPTKQDIIDQEKKKCLDKAKLQPVKPKEQEIADTAKETPKDPGAIA